MPDALAGNCPRSGYTGSPPARPRFSTGYDLHPGVPPSREFPPAELPAEGRTDQVEQAEGA
jgi:hypothetical protein